MQISQRILKNKEILFFTAILLLGSFLRLYRLPQTMQFLGDQGRDALIARRILIEKDPAFIGPVTSVGNMYLGPLYYYFMVFPLMLTYPSPIGPAFAVALIGIITLGLLYLLGRQMIGKRGALIAMYLYAISPMVIENVRFSWNPNIVPFFSLIAIWAIWKTMQRQYSYWVLIGICVAALFQLHYISLILIGCIGLVWIYQVVIQSQAHHIDPKFLRSTLLAIIVFGLSLIPLVVFDTKHDWLNVRALLSFFHPQVQSQSHFRSLTDGSGVFVAVLSMSSRVITEFFGIVAKTFSQKMLVLIVSVYLGTRAMLSPDMTARMTARKIIFFCLGISILLLSLYSSSVFNHYLGFIFPIVFLGFGLVLSSIWRLLLLRPLIIFIFCVVSVSSFVHYPGFLRYGSTVEQFDRSSAKLADHIPAGITFNLLSYSPTGDLQAMNYRYFLTASGKKPADPDDWTSFSRLYIIDEEHREQPLDEEQYVIKIWPNRKITDHFSILNGPEIYVLDR